MIVQSFRSVMWVGAVAGAALSCYMVSLRVASERASLERVESRILMAKRDIRALDTELSTRGRLRQLERWNVEVLALSPPTEGQFLTGEAQLAGLSSPTTGGQAEAPVMLASTASAKSEPAARRAKALPTDAAPRVRNPLLVQASATKPVVDAVPDKRPVKAEAKSRVIIASAKTATTKAAKRTTVAKTTGAKAAVAKAASAKSVSAKTASAKIAIAKSTR